MTTLDNTMKNAQKLMDETKDSAGQAATKARSTMLDGIHAVATTITMLRGLGVGDALRWVGLQRRTSPLVPMFTFGAGFLAGAAAGILFAPMAGADVRRKLADRAMGVERDAEKAGADVKAKVADKTDEIAGKAKEVFNNAQSKAKDALDTAESKAKDAFNTAESKAKDAAQKAGDAVSTGAANVKDAVKNAGDNTNGNGYQATNGTGGTSATKPQDPNRKIMGGHQSS